MSRVFGAFKNTNNRETVYAWFTFSHWLIYANSAANPIIYNFLSGEYVSLCVNQPLYETLSPSAGYIEALLDPFFHTTSLSATLK